MTQIVSSVFSLVEHSENFQEEISTKPEDRVERIFAVMDTVSMEDRTRTVENSSSSTCKNIRIGARVFTAD